MSAPFAPPRLYVIANAPTLAANGTELVAFASDLRAVGVTMLQLRDKWSAPRDIVRAAAEVQQVFTGSNAILILNDRADLAVLAGANGVHVGQTDLAPEDARKVVGPARLVGVSTHNAAQVQAADLTSADYLAIGPVFATASKVDAEHPVGLEGIRLARSLTRKPLVAIGGITRENAPSAIEAGADTVAVISGLFVPGETVEHVARDFLSRLR